MNIHDYFLETHKKVPFFWRELLLAHESNGRDGLPSWEPWCWVPVAAADAMAEDNGIEDPVFPMRLAGLAAWRATQGTYRFTPRLWNDLAAEPLDKIPSELLLHLPEWAVHMDLSEASFDFLGSRVLWALAWANSRDGRGELRILLKTETDEAPFIIPLREGKTLAEEICESFREGWGFIAAGNSPKAKKYTALIPMAGEISEAAAKAVSPVISALLYLCSDAPDIACREHPADRPERKFKTFPTKKGSDYGAFKPHAWLVGGEIERRIYVAEHSRKDGTGEGIRKSPHVRRAHWALYWVGKGRGTPRLNWLYPILVNAGEPE